MFIVRYKVKHNLETITNEVSSAFVTINEQYMITKIAYILVILHLSNSSSSGRLLYLLNIHTITRLSGNTDYTPRTK